MFNLFRKKPDYSAIFSSPSATYELIYGDSSKTSEILGDQSFIDAWLSSPQMPRISTLIRQEAIKGDVPSIKQMVWLAEIYYQDSAQISDASKRLVIQVSALKERIMFCEKSIDLGMKDWSYKAMVSSKNLYSLLESSGAPASDKTTRDALNGIVKYSKLFLESGCNDPELIEDAKNLLEHFGPLAKLITAVSAA